MLPERTFAIGGWAVIALGGLMTTATVVYGIAEVYWPFAAGGVLMIGFGAFLLYVSREAEWDRRRLTELPPDNDEPPRGLKKP